MTQTNLIENFVIDNLMKIDAWKLKIIIAH